MSCTTATPGARLPVYSGAAAVAASEDAPGETENLMLDAEALMPTLAGPGADVSAVFDAEPEAVRAPPGAATKPTNATDAALGAAKPGKGVNAATKPGTAAESVTSAALGVILNDCAISGAEAAIATVAAAGAKAALNVSALAETLNKAAPGASETARTGAYAVILDEAAFAGSEAENCAAAAVAATERDEGVSDAA